MAGVARDGHGEASGSGTGTRGRVRTVTFRKLSARLPTVVEAASARKRSRPSGLAPQAFGRSRRRRSENRRQPGPEGGEDARGDRLHADRDLREIAHWLVARAEVRIAGQQRLRALLAGDEL